MSLWFLHEKFTWVKLWSILLCMTGTIVVSVSDSEEGSSGATNPVWGDILCVVSAIFYALYTTLIRGKLPDEAKGEEQASTALFFGFLGLFNGLLLLPVALILHFTGVEPFHRLTAQQYGLIVGKGLEHSVFSSRAY
jgi:solute carrier family 35 protein F5